MTTKTTASTQWIKKNMLGSYSEELGRSLTEAEVRFQQCTEQLPVPEWYRKYRKPYTSKYLKNCTPIESRPAIWKTLDSGKDSTTGSPKKKKRVSPRDTPTKAQQNDSEPPRTASADSGFGDTFCRSGRSLKNSTDVSETSFTPCPTSSPSPLPSNASDSDVFDSPKASKNDITNELDSTVSSSRTTVRRSLNSSNTFPRISPSRKIVNLNLVFSKPFPPEQESLTVEDVSDVLKEIDSLSESKTSTSTLTTTATASSTPKTYYTTTKNFAMQNRSNSGLSNFAMQSRSNSGLTNCASSSIFNSTDSTLQNLEDSSAVLNEGGSGKTHASFLIADVSPYGVRECVRMFAGLASVTGSSTDTTNSSSEEVEHANNKVPPRCSPSPCSERFLTAAKKSTELERIVQRKRTDVGGLIQGIINELDKSSGGCLLTGGTATSSTLTPTSSIMTRTISDARSTFVRSMVKSLEDGNITNESAENRDSSNIHNTTYTIPPEYEEVNSTDSELAKSTSISVKSYDSPDERIAAPISSACSADNEAEEDESESDGEVYWAPCILLQLPRTSSRLSNNVLGMEARGVSPGLSPIKSERAEDSLNNASQNHMQVAKAWNLAGKNNEKRNSSRQLFRIDEMDAGYSAAYVYGEPTIV